MIKRLLQLSTLFLVAIPASAQVVAGTSYSNDSSTIALTGSVTMTTVDANSLVIVCYWLDDTGTAGVLSVPTATGLTFVQIGSTLRTSTYFRLGCFRAWTTSALGSTLITGTWTQSVGWALTATDYKGTAGTAGNNGSDAIGTINSTTGTATTITVTVTSSSHNNSKYLGALIMGEAVITKGASYSLNVTDFDATFVNGLTELSTNPVSPAANTAVNGSTSSGGSWGVFGIELLVAGATSTCKPELAALGAGKC